MHCSSSSRDRRAFFYFVSMARKDKVLCIHLRSLKTNGEEPSMASAIDCASVTKVLSATGSSVPQHHSPCITADASSESQLRPTPAKDRGEETDSDGPTDSSTYPDQSGKCHSLDVLNMQVLQTGDDLTLPPVILLKPGESFPRHLIMRCPDVPLRASFLTPIRLRLTVFQ